MQKHLLSTILWIISQFLFISLIKAQCTNTPLNCSINFNKEIFSDKQIVSSPGNSYASGSARQYDVNYYNKKDPVLTDCGTPSRYECSFDGAALTYDVYYPDGKVYPCYKTQPLPVIFLFPGGGFSDCINDSEGTSDYCRAFAKRGFVAINVNYRKGRLKDTSGNMSASIFLAMYRAFQDGRGAIRTVIARNDTNSKYRIDTNYIFIGGVSAGGEIALNIAYTPTETQNEHIFPAVEAVLGPIDDDIYIGKPTIHFSIRGVLNLWSAAFLTASKQYADILKQNLYNTPLIAFHGMADQTLYSTTTKVPLSKKAPFNSETKCLLRDTSNNFQTYTFPADMHTLYQTGSSGLYDIFTTQLSPHVPCELYLDSDMGHGLGTKSDFGFGNGKIDRNLLKIYIVQRAATFFQAVVNGKANRLRTTQFVDCINYRIKACRRLNLKDSNSCSASLLTLSNSQLDTHKNYGSQLYKLVQLNKVLYLHFETPGKAAIVLYDMNGVAVKKINSGYSQVVINCSNLSAGVYIVMVTQGKKVRRSQVILQ
jgi:poly(3-hydroxybutyrate) depolymerase